MKNFYEATVTKPKLKLSVELLLVPVEQCVCVILFNGDPVYDGTISGCKSIQLRTAIDSPVDLQIITTRVHPEALNVTVNIEGYEIIPLYLLRANPPTNYLDFNGSWRLKLPSFYPWFHEITGQGWVS